MKKNTIWIVYSILLAILLGVFTACLPSVTSDSNTGTDTDPVLTWQREGGIAGLCDGLVFYANGRVTITTCSGEVVKDETLSSEQLAQLRLWVEGLRSFEKEWVDPAVADAMTVRLTFTGMGKTSASESDMASISTYATQVYASIDSGNYAIDAAADGQPTDSLQWDHAVALILSGQVQQVVQTHALTVTLTLEDGTTLDTVEPAIDEVFAVITRCGAKCKNIVLATE